MAIQLVANYKKPTKGTLQSPDPRLRQVSNNIESINDSTRQIAQELINIIKAVDKHYKPWLGMAAPQIGFSKRIIAVKKNFRKYLTMINPEIVNQKWVFPAVSGCYSLKGLYLIKSPYWLKIKYMDIKGNFHTEVFTGGHAILLKQEIDHLNGRLVCD